MQPRRRARGLALQALYEIDCVGHPADRVLAERLEETPLPAAVSEFASELVHQVLAHRAGMDRLIAEYAPEWPVDQLAIVDRNVLRIAIYELAMDSSTPVKVAINEAVELAKSYGSDNSARFVNGVLGSLVERLDTLRAAVLRTADS
jgi:N utilization substance protein B